MGSLTLSKIDEYSLRIPVAPQFGGDRFIPMRSAGDENAQQLQYQHVSRKQQKPKKLCRLEREKLVRCQTRSRSSPRFESRKSKKKVSFKIFREKTKTYILSDFKNPKEILPVITKLIDPLIDF